MTRSYSVSLGALALTLIVVRGVIRFDPINAVLVQALIALVLFAGLGYLVGSIADRLTCELVEMKFRASVSDLINQTHQKEFEERSSDQSNGSVAT